MSEVDLNEDELRILNLGHKFAPIPKTTEVYKTSVDIEVQVKNNPEYLRIAEDIADDLKIYKNTKVRVCNQTQIKNNKYIQKTIKSIQKSRTDNNLILTKADKNAGLVMSEKTAYVEK